MAFFGTVLFLLPSGAVSFAVLPLVSALPHGTSFIPALLSETIRSLSLCQEAGRGRPCYYVHMLQLWFCSHLSVITRDQPMGFVRRNRIRAPIVLDFPFFGDIDGWLRYLCSLSPIDWTWRVKWGIIRWQGRPIVSVYLAFPWWAFAGAWGTSWVWPCGSLGKTKLLEKIH